MRAVLVAAGRLRPGSVWFRQQAEGASLLIAVDGGLRHVLEHGLRPDLLVGDLDSVTPGDLEQVAGVEAMRFPRDKDRTDLELALDAALARGATSLVVAGALGARHDHGLANLLIAARLKRDLGVEICLAGDGTVAWPLAAGDELELPVQPGDLFSLLALEAGCRLDVRGAVHELEAAPLPLGSGLGISNVARPPTTLRIHAGLLLAMIQDDDV